MSDEQQLTVLRCELCSKPFNKDSTLKRHRYYCRTRKGSAQHSRSRSCATCAKAKVRCDNKSPNCSRCAAKGLRCDAQRKVSLGNAQLGEDAEATVSVRHLSTTDIASVLPNESNPSPNLDVNLVANNDTLPLDFDFSDLVPWSPLASGSVSSPSFDYSIPEQTSLDALSVVLPSTNNNAEPYSCGPIISTPIASMPTYHMRSFTQRPATTTTGITNATATMMLRIMTSYPIMLRDPKNPPPFIHPSFLVSRSLESLNTCASLVQMLASGVKGSKKLLWKNVRLECERLGVQWPDLDKWDLLASMQALLIYMLLRLQEGETKDNNLDVLLLTTLFIIGRATNTKIGFFDCTSPLGRFHGSTHEDWIFEESRRRMALTFRTMALLFSTEPAGACVLVDGFILAPLPGRKQLWEARDETEWLAARSWNDDVFGIKPGGKMAKLDAFVAIEDGDSGQEVDEAESSRNWVEWCAGMDGLGALVMLAGSLPF